MNWMLKMLREWFIKMSEKYGTSPEVVEALYYEWYSLQQTEKELIRLFGESTK